MSEFCVECGMRRQDHPFADMPGQITCAKFVAHTKAKPICIVESPYAGDLERNRKYLLRCFEYCFKTGYLPIASHAMFTQVLDDNRLSQRKRGIEWGYEYWQCADKICFFVDYDLSPGMLAALNLAHERCPDKVMHITIGRNP